MMAALAGVHHNRGEVLEGGAVYPVYAVAERGGAMICR